MKMILNDIRRKEDCVDTFEKEQSRKMNAALKEIGVAIKRLGNEIVKLREAIERNGYAVLPTIEMTAEEEKGEDDGTEE